ncbi:MAG: UDP-N-acetylglucosamine 2-epimerase (non-hydrolyzing) [Deltaproteobacteria bacterium]|nr:UDP-N-acetylglucosamine 2-epimerase (non-hydrolyzing) [Deltaproteobacteria bacterium]
MKLIIVVGARPNFMKAAPILDAISEHNLHAARRIERLLVHTGQHYDEKLSRLFFDDLGIQKPDIDLGVGSGSHAEQTAEVMKKFEKVCLDESPTHILVVGDVNSTIACALVAAKLGIKVIHVEAGLRSFDRTMPEEINRVLTDAISDYLFITERSAEENLIKEGVDKGRIFFVGNVMIDTLIKHRQKAMRSTILDVLGLSTTEPGYGLLTLHRPSNVDDKDALANLLGALEAISSRLPIVFPVHPRTRKRIEEFGLGDRFATPPADKPKRGLYTIDPLGYLDFLRLMSEARVVLTDSGGIQEETTVLGVPCITMRENTERPVTITHGTNCLAGTDKDAIIRAALEALDGKNNAPKPAPPKWDGNAALRIVEVLTSLTNNR